MKLGIDIGSTTAKTVLLDPSGQLHFFEYKRHNAAILPSVISSLEKALEHSGDQTASLSITGSAGLGIAENFSLPFVQELVASTNAATKLFPKVKTLIDIGGEDSKVIFFSDKKRPDIRMNGSCAGGTGSFIDQMASLLNVSVSELDELASRHTRILPIASRCGVFAKTDVQNLLSREVSKEDIAASIFYAVAIQIITTLSRGFEIRPSILFCGGPLSFLPSLGRIFTNALNISESDVFRPDHPELFPAIGAAISANENSFVTLRELIQRLSKTTNATHSNINRLPSLFKNGEEFDLWSKQRLSGKISKVNLSSSDDTAYFLGIDSGSTTTKIVLINDQKQIAFEYYTNNKGKPIEAVALGLEKLKQNIFTSGRMIPIVRTCITGYGEDLIKTAFGLDQGIVETIAHYTAAKIFHENVSFILDIGGQDMKAIYVKDGVITNIEVNEACSSGCGSFLESFSKNLGYPIQDFAAIACGAKNPCNLGTRCTVFMNSKVKQALREGATIEEISAGLAYSIVKNFLYKVLKIRDTSVLGDAIVVQGGTFKNPAVHKAFESIIGKKILCPEISELMGAYGAAISALNTYTANPDSQTTFAGLQNLAAIQNYQKKSTVCSGCTNQCPVNILFFSNNNRFFTGNRCEKHFSNQGEKRVQGFNLPDFKYDLLFNRQTEPEKQPVLTIGIPRVLNFYENFPFFNTLLVHCGIRVVLSPDSNESLCEKGYQTVMSENICFPAKIIHGHILDLIHSGVDRIFYPIIPYEKNHHEHTNNYYNCPIVSGYPDVIKNSINPEAAYGVPLDSPTLTFNDIDLLKKSCFSYLKQFGVNKRLFKKAFFAAMEEQRRFKQSLQAKASEVIAKNKKAGRFLLLLAGRPYHVDPLINHHIPKYITDLGVDVITEDSIPDSSSKNLSDIQVLTQWVYTNRLFESAKWASQKDHVEFVQLNSFGCGPDALSVDEVKSILNECGKNQTLIRIDENSSPGSVKLRIRSLIESLQTRDKTLSPLKNRVPRITTKPFSATVDRRKIMISPDFGPFYSNIMQKLFHTVDINLAMLQPADKQSVEIGLQYTNNEICYPAIICIGNILKSLKDGLFDPDQVFVGISQTGGQCRASSYTSLIKKALVAAGYENIPVAAIPTGHYDISDSSEFTLDTDALIINGFLLFLYADSLVQMYNATVFRETIPGSALAVINKYISEETLNFDSVELSPLLALLNEAVIDFNDIDIKKRPFPKIGLVGEIYVKYNSLANHYLVDWLRSHEIEVIVPPLIDFFLHPFIDHKSNARANVTRSSLSTIKSFILEKKTYYAIRKFNHIMKHFRFFRPFHDIKHIAKKGSSIVNPVQQFGEGWLLPAEVISFAEEGINDVLCLQPFGCLANHIIARGTEKILRDLYPQLNLLFLDMDADTSEANMHNRLHFLIQGARESLVN